MRDISDTADFGRLALVVDDVVVDFQAIRLSAAAQVRLLEVERELAALRQRFAQLEGEWIECETVLDRYTPAWLSTRHAERDAR